MPPRTRREYTVELPSTDERVPGVLQLPSAGTRHPAALLIHGFSSRKERMAEAIGRKLVKRGIASLSVDLPLHGERPGSLNDISVRTPFAIVSKWRLALREATSALDYLATHPEIDPSRIALVGYSLGAFLGVHVAADDSRVKAVVLAAGGDLPAGTPFAALIRSVADPLRAIRRIRGRPVLMVNGQLDRTVRADQAERLYAAAGEPKEVRWYPGGHWPQASEIDAAAEWLAARLV